MEQMEHLYDVVVIGGGPAGLTAALYLARARYRVVVVEQERFGGQITITSEVVNYPGVERTSGAELTETMRRQAEGFGAEFLLAEVTGLELEGDVKTVRTSRGALSCFGVLLATGAHPRMVGFRGEEQFRGRGVAYCATCDGEFFTGKDVFVVGGGFAAAEESVFLTKYARHVTILIRGDDFSCAQATADAARNHEKITILTNTVVEEVSGDTALRSIRMRNSKTGQETEHQAADGETFGVFVFAGYEPATELVRGLAELDGQGYILTDRSQKTTADGLYAAGDVCVKPLRQVVTAVGDGALAATELERLCAAIQQKTGLRPQAPKSRTPEPEAQAQTKDGLFTGEMLSQLHTVFDRMASSLILRLCLDETPVSAELEHYMQELAAQSDKLSVEQGDPSKVEHLPCVQICRSDGSWTGLAFHGVPGGHEFTSFVLGLYNAAGPGQALDEETEAAIRAIQKPVELQVLVSLSCTMCPELVTAAQRLAAAHPDISAQVYDLNHFPDLREQYQVMSVPCLVVNGGEQISFGKKNIRQLLELLMP
ncbi:putative alkyl hydroperoxide reductase F subunit [Pseudoflavonifractor capillosus ATCC 29799]|uniref:Putative alkyl hydroperoxide reductase F subunit n=1 Tax=Pseudoflavonifractor capillosus ATCC 29799 TaxID=411467 RepID=A6NSP9_9FIRM|nr:FAD-dependent oxidoreductase [Pseudoflavonifractor capillosus]EDN00876.1 putative alkyl hydroperoxide reductase F subunit [Pseudoflavonifractor capillosus ATCC 29799]